MSRIDALCALALKLTPLYEVVEEVGVGFQFDVGDVFCQRLDGGSLGGVSKHYGGALERSVADLGYAVERDVGDEADVDSVLDVDVICEAAGEVEASIVGRGCADSFEDDVLPAIVSGLGLSKCGDVGAGDGETILGVKGVFIRTVVEVSEFVHDVVATEFCQEIDETGAADADGRCVADCG